MPLKTIMIMKLNFFLDHFLVATFRSVEAYDNSVSVSSLDLICKHEFDLHQLQWKLFIHHCLDKVKYISQVLAENTGN